MLMTKTPQKINARLLLVCTVAFSVGLSMAWISIGKFALFVFGLAFLVWRYFIAPQKGSDTFLEAPHYATRAVLLSLAAFAVSLLWTTADIEDSVGSIAKYGKLLTILLIPLLLKNRQEVIYAIVVFVTAQLFLVSSSWLLFFGVRLPWATAVGATSQFAVFSTYLDQGVISATVAAICWHLRGLAPGKFGRQIFIGIGLLCMLNVLFVLIGRTGHAVIIVLLSMAAMWRLPKKYRWTVVALPVVFLALAMASSSKVRDRTTQVASEIKAFSKGEGRSIVSGTSSGVRLQFWQRSMQSISESPILGSGVGSWGNEYNRVEKNVNPAGALANKRGNPHQEYLLWGVQLGVIGILLFVALLAAIFRDTLNADEPSSRAAQSVLAALAISCLFNSSVYDALIGDFFCVALGLMLALAASSLPPVKEPIAAAA